MTLKIRKLSTFSKIQKLRVIAKKKSQFLFFFLIFLLQKNVILLVFQYEEDAI